MKGGARGDVVGNVLCWMSGLPSLPAESLTHGRQDTVAVATADRGAASMSSESPSEVWFRFEFISKDGMVGEERVM